MRSGGHSISCQHVHGHHPSVHPSQKIILYKRRFSSCVRYLPHTPRQAASVSLHAYVGALGANFIQDPGLHVLLHGVRSFHSNHQGCSQAYITIYTSSSLHRHMCLSAMSGRSYTGIFGAFFLSHELSAQRNLRTLRPRRILDKTRAEDPLARYSETPPVLHSTLQK